MYGIVSNSTNPNLPVGTITLRVSGSSNMLPCDGRTVSQHMYPELYQVIGTQYGGNSSTFNLPNLQGRVIPSLTYQDFWETWPCIHCKKTFSNEHDRSTWWCQVKGQFNKTYHPMTNLEYLEFKEKSCTVDAGTVA